jgi:spermidine/putrescine transport system ATP-binding protein
LKQLNREVGATFVYVTHDQEEALTMSDRIAVMNDGRILQIGPPAEIYERPRNRFVADFIGQTNFLDVTVLGVVVDQANVQIAGSPPVRVRLPAAGAKRGPATLAIRPEKVFLSDDLGGAAPTGWNTLDATLVDIIYLGTHTHYVTRLPGGATIAVHRQNRAFGEAEPAVGEPIRVAFNPQSAMLLEE